MGPALFCQVSSDTRARDYPPEPFAATVVAQRGGLRHACVGEREREPVGTRTVTDERVEDAVIPAPGTGKGQNAEPATQFVAEVNCRFGGDAPFTNCDEPFNCHPPDTGEGIVLIAL